MSRPSSVLWWGLLLSSGLLGCSARPRAPASSVETALPSERGGIGVLARWSQLAEKPSLEPRRSLAVTEQAILTDESPDEAAPELPAFTLRAVLGQLAHQAGAGQTADDLFRQLWDTANAAPGRSGRPGPYCSDNDYTFNGFPYTCRAAEGAQAAPDAAIGVDAYIPIGLFNRFDLAREDGSSCGEYRMVFAKTPPEPLSRNLLIFEAALPNPLPDLGLEGCRPVARFWAELSQDDSTRSRALALRRFYFQGLPGFSPVIHIAHYGHNAAGLGQVRVNMFLEGPWLLREFKLRPDQGCDGSPCAFLFFPVTTKNTPLPDLFNPASTEPLAAEFQNTFFPSQVASLATADINRFRYLVPDKYNTGQSDSERDVYVERLGEAPSDFRARIQRELDALGSTLTPDQIVARAEVLSCAGCHEKSDDRDLGGNLRWPKKSTPFVHVAEDEIEDGPDGPRFQLSNVLTDTLLPHRQTVLEGFLATSPDHARFVGQSVPERVPAGTSFTVSITMRNTGGAAWTAVDAYELGAPQDDAPWGQRRVPLEPSETIAPGQSKTFTFSLTAPEVPGSYAFQWRMRRDPVDWFGDTTEPVSIVVEPAAGPAVADRPDATFVSQSVPAQVTAGTPFTVSITMRNTGNTTWTEEDACRLGDLQDSFVWGSGRARLAPGERIPPGATKTFSLPLIAPAEPGVYPFQWRMLRDFVAWFGDLTPLVLIQVPSPTP